MFETVVVDREHALHEVEVAVLLDQKDVITNQLVHQVLPELRRDLQGVDSEREQHFDHAVNVPVLVMLSQFGLVFLHDSLGDEFASLRLALVDDDLVVLAQLDLVVLNALRDILVLAHLLHGVQDLQQVDRHREDLSSRLQNLLVLLLELFHLLLQVYLSSALAVVPLEETVQTRQFLSTLQIHALVRQFRRHTLRLDFCLEALESVGETLVSQVLFQVVIDLGMDRLGGRLCTHRL